MVLRNGYDRHSLLDLGTYRRVPIIAGNRACHPKSGRNENEKKASSQTEIFSNIRDNKSV